MHLLNTLIIIVFLALIRQIYIRWTESRVFHIAALKHGCQQPRKYSHRWPWGFDLLHARLSAVKAGRYNRLYLQQFREYGNTWEENLAGARVINTIEPANIQQVAALSFQDYGKPAMRNKALAPFFGNGIFSQDGAIWKHSRDIIKPLFTRAEVSDVDSFKIYVDRMLSLIPGDGATVDIHPLLLKMVQTLMRTPNSFIFGWFRLKKDSSLTALPSSSLVIG